MQFMNSSLANLAKNLGGDMPITKRHFANLSSKQIDLITRKRVYPYEYIDSHDRFKETKLPPIHKFYGHLNGKIKQTDYEHAQRVWKEFECKNLGEYHDLYLKTDVLLLADIWMKFRKSTMEYYGLDPSHYISAASLSWDAMLKYTGAKIELITDMTMYDFVEKAKRGGIAMAGHRHFKANNPKMGKAFNPSKPTSWISYVDATNLYGWEMSQYFPIGGYKWEVPEKDTKAKDWWTKEHHDKAYNLLDQGLTDLNCMPGDVELHYFKTLLPSDSPKSLALLEAYTPREIMDSYVFQTGGQGFTLVKHPFAVYSKPDTHECINGKLPLCLVLDIDAPQKSLDEQNITRKDLLSRILNACADILYFDLDEYC